MLHLKIKIQSVSSLWQELKGLMLVGGMFECELFPNWMVVLCSPTFAGSRRVKADPLSPPYQPQPRLSNLINPTNPNKKSHKSKSKLHKSRKMLFTEFLLVGYFCPKDLILGIKAQGQPVQGITLRAVAIKGFDDKRSSRSKKCQLV